MDHIPLNPEEEYGIIHAAEEALQQEHEEVEVRKGHALSPEEEEEEAEETLRGLPPWQEQITVRAIVVGLFLGSLFCVVTHKLNLGPGIIPSLNIAAGLLGFMLLKLWATTARHLGVQGVQEFGQQENNIVQTFVTASSAVAFTGGFGNYLLAMDHQSFENLGGETTAGNREQDVFEPHMWRVLPYLLLTSVVGVFMLALLRKTMIINYGLPYPSGTATGLMIRSFHTSKGAATAGAQLRAMLHCFAISFLWDAARWALSGTTCSFCATEANTGSSSSSGVPGVVCGGFEALPLFGMLAAHWTWNFNWQLNLVGAGMICPHVVNVSMMVGAALTWGFLWPLIKTKEGDWYPEGLGDTSFSGLFGYKVFITVSILMGDGFYNVLKVLLQSAKALAAIKQQQAAGTEPGAEQGPAHSAWRAVRSQVTKATQQVQAQGRALLDRVLGRSSGGLPAAAGGEDAEELRQPLVPATAAAAAGDADEVPAAAAAAGDKGADAGGPRPLFKESAADKKLRTTVFMSDTVPAWISVAAWSVLGVLAVLFLPLLYGPALKWYHVALAHLLGPLMSLPNSFGCGLTDWDMSTMYGKIGIFLFAAWAGSGGGVVVGLAICGVLLSSTSMSATLMQDLRTSYLTLAAPKAMFVTQVAGALAGVVLAPLTFLMFWNTGLVGQRGGPYPAPYATIFRAMAVFSTQGLSVLPLHCGTFMAVFFAGAILINLARDTLPPKYARFMPSPMGMGIPMFLGAWLAVDMCVGSAILAVWEYVDPVGAELLAPAVASGLIVGDGVWSIPASLLGVLGVQPPLCMGFGATSTPKS